MSPDDIVMAFFPCTRFEDQIILGFRGELFQLSRYTDEQKLIYDINLHEELHRNYLLVSQMAILAIRKGLRMVIENPYSEEHYLRRYWSIKPAIIDRDRTLNGDYFKKPTQFYFIGHEPKKNLVFESLEYTERRNVEHMRGADRTRRRSEIHPQYANRFIRQYLIEPDKLDTFGKLK